MVTGNSTEELAAIAKSIKLEEGIDENRITRRLLVLSLAIVCLWPRSLAVAAELP